LVPYYSRQEIDRLGLLEGRSLEIAWVADPVEAFFLHIQGSGKILLPDGGYLRVHYAVSNGRPYRSVGRLLVDTGRISRGQASASSIMDYLKAHPEGRDPLMDYNERYVFFEETKEGPLGNLNILLTPGRSLATDQRLYPPGVLAYVETEVPVVDSNGRFVEWRSMGRFMVNQDTGAAILGPNRADIYWGSGESAGRQAGFMHSQGRLYFLAPLEQ
jgi:membrane-bound lytic murein transglycosylase A